MVILRGNVNDTEFELSEEKQIQQYQVNTAEISFEFDETWNDYSKYIIFKNKRTNQIIRQDITENTCIIPSVLENGYIDAQIFGEKVENDLIIKRQPTNLITFLIKESINPDDVYKDKWSIFITKIENYTQNFETFKNNTEKYKENINKQIEKINSDINNVKETNNSNLQEINDKFDLQNTTNTEISNDLNSEKKKREEADTTLQKKIENEETSRIDSDTKNQEKNDEQDKKITSNSDNIEEIKKTITSLKTASGHTLDLTIDNSTFVITATLKNADGTELSTQNIDLPLETMVVNADYKKDTKEIEITLQNGNKISFSVADLIDGLVSTNTFETKIVEINNKINQNIKDISAIKEEQTTQNTNIQNNKNNIDKNSKAITDLNNRYFLKLENIKEVELEN